MAYVDSARETPPRKGKESKTPTARLNRYWKEIEAYGKTSADWKEQGEKIVKMYLDQHRTVTTARRFALLWSNIETLKPAVYAKTPTILCSRRYKDPHPIGRVAAEILERATNTTFDLYKVDEVFRMVRDDRLLVARGQAWVRYEANFKKAKDDQGGEYDKVAGEKVCVDYVHWCDFGHNVSGTWTKVWIVWRKVYMTKEEASERFTEKIAEKLTYGAKVDPDGKEEMGEHVACIYEAWDKKKKQTVFMSRDYPEFLEEPDEPPLNLRDFFPCPEPCYGSKTGKSLIPTPDYRYYQDQAMEIDDLTEKIANLTDYLIVRGFVPAGPSADGADAVRMMIQNLQDGLTRNKSVFIPVESWAGFTEKGGAAKLIDWLPIDIIVKALQMAIEARGQLVQDVYQITGISDILRGQTDPDETLGAQQLKSQTGSRRIKNAKDDLARFCKDIGQLVAEVIAEQFQPQTLAQMTGYKYEPMITPVDPAQAQMGGAPMPPPQQPPMQPGMPQMNGSPMPQMGSPPMQPGMPQAQKSPSGQTFNDEVIALLRSDRQRGFLIDIETDSTIQPDEDMEKQRRVEFVQAVGQFMKEALPAAQMAPTIIPMLGETLLFMARGFRAGRSLEEVIERSMQQMQQQIAQAQANPQPTPDQVKAQAEQQKMQMQAKMEQQKMAAEQQARIEELQIKREELEIKKQEIGLKLQEMEATLQLKRQEAEMKMQLEAKAHELDARIKQNEAEQKAIIAQQAAEAEQVQMQQKGQMEIEQGQQEFFQNREMAKQEFSGKQQMAAEAHRAKMQRDSMMADRESSVRVDHEKQLREGEAKAPKQPKRIRGRYNDKPIELEIS